jgi:hypothetical protein
VGKLNKPKALTVDATPDDLARFARHVRVEAAPNPIAGTPCHTWTGCADRKGYGGFKWRGAKVWAHRWICAAVNGPIPSRRDVDHVCRNPSCVNPAHLRGSTPRKNRGWRRGMKGYGEKPEPAAEVA